MRCIQYLSVVADAHYFMLFCLVGMIFKPMVVMLKRQWKHCFENKTVDEVLTELEQGTEFVFFTTKVIGR